MKQIWRGKRYWFQFFCLSLIIGVGFLFFNNVFDNFGQQIGQKISEFTFLKPVLAQQVQNRVFKIKGWAWSGTTGWVSLSCSNIVNPITNISSCSTSQYGLEVKISNDNKEITGWAWSSNLGWICFGNTLGCDGIHPAGNKKVTFNCFNQDGITADPECDDALTASLSGWAKIVNLGDKGWISLSCKNTNTCNAPDINYGTIIDFEEAILGGTTQAGDSYPPVDKNWAWHYAGGGAGNAYGTGWILFNPGSEILAPYLQVKGGDAFARKFTSFLPPPRGQYNAQYLIQSKETISSRFRACISNTSTDCRLPTYRLEIPTTKACVDNTTFECIDRDRPVSFKLGRFDFKNLITRVTGTTHNRYNHEVAEVNDFTFLGQSLKNKVYVLPSDMTVSDVLQIKNGAANELGAGTIVVKGNLIINNNIEYEPIIVGNISNKRLASVVWIVLGDVKVDSSVTRVDGNFIVLGTRNPNNLISCVPTNDNPVPEGCGRFNTCYDAGDCSVNKLMVTGSVFARQFFLNRTYVSSVDKKPAELFQADGRMQLNPPPGFADFAKGLPTFSRQ
ncbi:MAG: hypothetical protein AAB657_01685 [Patescibacteria group bacterium]